MLTCSVLRHHTRVTDVREASGDSRELATPCRVQRRADTAHWTGVRRHRVTDSCELEVWSSAVGTLHTQSHQAARPVATHARRGRTRTKQVTRHGVEHFVAYAQT